MGEREGHKKASTGPSRCVIRAQERRNKYTNLEDDTKRSQI